MVLGFGSYNYVFYLLLTWLPRYLSSALHVDLLHSFLYTGVPWLIATVADVAVGGWLVDVLIKAWMECEFRSQERACDRDCMWTWDSGSSQYAQRDDGADLDQHLDWRPFGCVCSGVVGSFVDRSAQQRWPGWRDYQFFQSGLGHLRADHYRISGCCPTIVCVGIWSVGDLSADRDLRLYLSAGQD